MFPPPHFDKNGQLSTIHFVSYVPLYYTVWKFQDFSITQMLREISFGDSKSAKSAIFTHLETLNFDFYAILHFVKYEIDQKFKSQSLQN